MNPKTNEITCEIVGETALLIDIFTTLKENRINLRKVEFMESLTQQETYYLHLEVTCLEESPDHLATLEKIRSRLTQSASVST